MVDKYIELELHLIAIDMILRRRGAFRHLMFNRGAGSANKDGVPWVPQQVWNVAPEGGEGGIVFEAGILREPWWFSRKFTFEDAHDGRDSDDDAQVEDAHGDSVVSAGDGSFVERKRADLAASDGGSGGNDASPDMVPLMGGGDAWSGTLRDRAGGSDGVELGGASVGNTASDSHAARYDGRKPQVPALSGEFLAFERFWDSSSNFFAKLLGALSEAAHIGTSQMRLLLQLFAAYVVIAFLTACTFKTIGWLVDKKSNIFLVWRIVFFFFFFIFF